MYPPSLIIVTCSVAMMLHAPHCIGQSNVVFYEADTNAIAVTFVDTNLSASAQVSIVTDLHLCLQEWGKKSELDLGAYELGVIGYLNNFKSSPHYPENIEFPKNVVSNGTSGLALQIPKSLSDVYTNAFVFAAANSNIVAAGYEFVRFISSSNFVSLSSNALPNYVLFKNKNSAAITESNEIVRLASLSVFAMTIRGHWLIGVMAFCAALAETIVALSWLGALRTSIPVWLDKCFGLVCWSGPFLLFFTGLLLVFAKDVRRKKGLLVVSFGCIFIATVHCVLSYMIAVAWARFE